MENAKRIEAITRMIEEIWLSAPELRFNQLIHSLQVEYDTIYNSKNPKEVYTREDRNGIITFVPETFVDLYYLEDSDFEEYLRFYLNGIKQGGGEV